MLTDEEIKQMIVVAKKAREDAFVLSRKRKVGACVLTTDGKYYGGGNIESVVFGLGMCAERAAINHALVNGKYTFKAILAYDETPLFSCGVCLQYLTQFSQINDTDIEVLSCDAAGTLQRKMLRDALPHAYFTENNLESLKKYSNSLT